MASMLVGVGLGSGRRHARGRRRARRPVRRPAFYGYIGSGNLGNDASFEVALDWLTHTGGPDVRPQVITLTPQEVRDRYGLDAVRLRAAGPRPGRRDRPFVIRALARLMDLPRSMRLVQRSDAVIVPGMGVLEEKLGVRPWGLPLWLFATAVACRLLRRPFVLLCVGAEPAGNPLTRRLFAATVGLAAHVSYRDEWSARSMRLNGADGIAPVAADLVFADRRSPVRRPEPGRVVVGVMRYYGDADDPLAGEADNIAYLEAIAFAVDALVTAGDHVVLVGGDRADEETAHEVRRRVAARRPGVEAQAVQVRCAEDFDSLCAEMARAEVAVVTRFHNLICALRLGVPVVSVGYADKNAVLMKDLGLTGFDQPIATVDPRLLLEQVERARHGGWPDRDLAARVARKGESVRRVLAEVAELLRLAEATVR